MSRKIAVYVCDSSKQQDQRSQEAELRHWLVGKADADVSWYRDNFTGKTIERSGMERLQADTAAGRIGCIVVWRLDRLGRTARELFDIVPGFATEWRQSGERQGIARSIDASRQVDGQDARQHCCVRNPSAC